VPQDNLNAATIAIKGDASPKSNGEVCCEKRLFPF
jgi:hypothetical protein